MSGGGKGGSVVVGYRYLFGILMGLCRGPVNAICEIKIGDRRAWIGSSGSTSLNLFSLPGNEKTIRWNIRKKAGAARPSERVITEAAIDTNGDGSFDALVIGTPTAITTTHGPLGTITVSSNGEMSLVVNPGYDGEIPTLRYRIDAKTPKTYSMGQIMSSRTVYISAYDLFGGESGEGGVQGTLEVKMGNSTQTMVGSEYAKMRPGDLPGMRGTVTAFFDGIVCMLNPYPKAWTWRMWRTNAGWENNAPWYPEKATIMMPVETDADFTHLHGMNPAHIIYECTTNRQWGRGKEASAIDVASFVACADQLHAENFGLCLRWARKDSVSAFITTVINHIGAAVFTSRKTGLITMRLIRGDYDMDEMPTFDTESGLLSIDASELSSGSNAINMVEVKYRDQVTNEDSTVKIGNLAALQSANGVVNSKSVEYPGVPVASLAMRLAQRDLRAESAGIRRFTLTFDRRGYAIEPGSVVVIRDVKRNIQRTAVRVGNVDVSAYREGKIKVVAVQDVFSLPSASYAASVPHSWIAPERKPCIAEQKVFEMPYFMLARSLTSSELAAVPEDSGYLATASAQGQAMNLGYRIVVRDSAPTSDDAQASSEYICSI